MPDEGWLIAQLKRLYRERPEEVTEEEIRRRIDESDVPRKVLKSLVRVSSQSAMRERHRQLVSRVADQIPRNPAFP
jgi:hypothetical protein